MEGWTAFDIVVGLTVGLCFLVALAKGFTRLTLGIAAWIGAAVITLYAFTPVSALAREMVSPPEIADILTVPVVFITALVLLKLLASALGDGVASSGVGFLDRSLGGLLGLLFGLALVSTAYLGLSALIKPADQPDWVREAKSRPLLSYGARLVADLGPELGRRAVETDTGQRVMEKQRETAPRLRQSVEKAAEPIYEEGQRRMLDRTVQELLKESDQCDPEVDRNCPAGTPPRR
ncbi:membrane protein required for colicin V production [Rhodothalassium salexigens DSM 2132]|uniref:Membrane protein required for colicin V production n=1 Tax=Rhodothalassium salexigens DSM 2132 TaxID=1188247 RepID=A0A4R2PGV9_RHOSA|nr:CvpA family protein [Rhodothalassium salexigens]MBB4211840.1 membrane protein required for colicin V production [Rhodothalassium salexigens DSM 2132]MBK1638863.1 hypothetical protein [Rhodothalassium salexigens DSM 2132]TCP33864.1 membrane protein required for colicin V production [Rhodothalassium salexigens DSM 2132]